MIEDNENIEIQHAEKKKGQYIIKIDKRTIKVDGYCKENNTVYEFYGDYWHGNPNVFDSCEINKTINKTYGELYDMTKKREEIIISCGYNLKTIWESDFNMLNVVGVYR